MINPGDAKKLADFCELNLDLTGSHYATPYHSLGPCILDCVYSLRAKYFASTVKVVERYAEAFMGSDAHAGGYTLNDFVNHINSVGGPSFFSDTVIHNRQKIANILKSDICLELANKLIKEGVQTKNDFASLSQKRAEEIIRSVKGLGDAAVNYLFMLAGDPTRCKPDVHIHKCIEDATGHSVTNSECQTLFTDAVALLRPTYHDLTVALLDGFVWNKYRV